MSIDLELAFVDRIDDGYTTRLDLEDGENFAVHRDTRFDPPPLRYAATGTLLRDGEEITAAVYGNREIHLVLTLADTLTLDEMAEQFQAVFRELNRANNFLRYRPGTTEPVYFRTFRTSPESVEFIPTERRIRATVPAEPFGYGEKVTLGTVNVVSNPASTNGCYLDVSNPNGDVSTPLFFSVPYADVAFVGRMVTALGIRRGDTATTMQRVLQAEGSTKYSADTTDQPNDAAMSGAGSNFVRCTYATSASLVDRFGASLTTGDELRGAYRVYMRVRQSAVATHQAKLYARLDGEDVECDTVSFSGSTSPKWIEMGEVNLPITMDQPTDGFSGIPTDVASPEFRVQLGRTSGTGNLDVDCLLFIPSDDRFAYIRWPESIGPDHVVVDGNANSAVCYTAGNAVRQSVPIEIEGQIPEVTPGTGNRIHFCRAVFDAVNSPIADALTSDLSLTAFYWPRYLTVRPPSS